MTRVADAWQMANGCSHLGVSIFPWDALIVCLLYLYLTLYLLLLLTPKDDSGSWPFEGGSGCVPDRRTTPDSV